MDDPLGIKKLDETERMYAPENLPPEEQGRVLADEGMVNEPPGEPPAPAPVAVGSSGSANMALPGIGRDEMREAGDLTNAETNPALQADADDETGA